MSFNTPSAIVRTLRNVPHRLTLSRNFTVSHRLHYAESAPWPQSQHTASHVRDITPSITPQAKHPSTVSHPALESPRQKRGSDAPLYLTFLGLLLAGGPLSYWYWEYREEHMRRKKEAMLAEIRAKYAAKG